LQDQVASSVAGVIEPTLQASEITGWSEDPERNRSIGMAYGRRALLTGEEDAATLANAAYILARFSEDVDTTLGIADRALALNPSFTRGWYLCGNMKSWAGDHDAALERLEIALRLSPLARVGSQPFV
jgi:tetratricopeptide (TPR) repeat protein